LQMLFFYVNAATYDFIILLDIRFIERCNGSRSMLS
jgi:hypothetical protein